MKCAGGSQRANPSKGDLGSPQEESGDEGRDSRIHMRTSWQQRSCEAREGGEGREVTSPSPTCLNTKSNTSSPPVLLSCYIPACVLFYLTLVTEHVYLSGTILSVS